MDGAVVEDSPRRLKKETSRKETSDFTWEHLEVCEGGERTVSARALDQVDVADGAGANLVVDGTEGGVEPPENEYLKFI